MEIIFHSHANKTHFHKKGCGPSLILKVRVFGTWKWPIELWQPVCHTGKATGRAKVFLCTLFFRFVLFSPYFTCLLSKKSPSKACVTTWQQKQKVKWLFFLNINRCMCILPNCMTISCKFVKCRWIFLELHSWSPRKKEKINHGLFFTCTSIPKMSHWRISSRSQAVTSSYSQAVWCMQSYFAHYCFELIAIAIVVT